MSGDESTPFPRTRIGDLSVSRMIIGTNWFLGYSHTSFAKDKQIQETMSPERIADILEVFLAEGVDTIIGPGPAASLPWEKKGGRPLLFDGIAEAEQRTGKKMIIITTPGLDVSDDPEAMGRVEETLDLQVQYGAAVCMPHQWSTDRLVDIEGRRIRKMEVYCRMIRERGMIPALSTHMPETIVFADATELDVEAYLQIYNAAGFLMHLEADWIHRIIWGAKHPVMTIKPMAAGRLLPLVGLSFAWSHDTGDGHGSGRHDDAGRGARGNRNLAVGPREAAHSGQAPGDTEQADGYRREAVRPTGAGTGRMADGTIARHTRRA